MANYCVSFWKGDSLGCKFGTYKECEDFIEETLLNKAEYQDNSITLMDHTPQPNIEDQEDYEKVISCPVNMNMDEWDQQQDIKSEEYFDYLDNLMYEDDIF
jgi:hypothetical protein